MELQNSEAGQASPNEMSGMDNQNTMSDGPNIQTERIQPTDDIRSRVDAEKEYYKQKQMLKRREEELARREQELAQNGQKKKDFNSILDDILNSDEQPQDQKEEGPLSHEEIIQRAKEEIRRELDEERNQQYEEYEQQKFVEDLSSNIQDFVVQSAEQFPLLSEINITDQVVDDVIQELTHYQEEYGEEYANKWFNEMDWAGRLQEYEQTLVNNFKSMLQSEKIRDFLRENLSEESIHSKNEGPRTLNKEDFSKVGNSKSLSEMSIDDRVAYAKAQLRKQRLQSLQ